MTIIGFPATTVFIRALSWKDNRRYRLGRLIFQFGASPRSRRLFVGFLSALFNRVSTIAKSKMIIIIIVIVIQIYDPNLLLLLILERLLHAGSWCVHQYLSNEECSSTIIAYSGPVKLALAPTLDVVNVPTADCMLLLLLFSSNPLDIGIFLDLVGSFDPCYDHGHSFWVRFPFGPTWGGPFLSHWSVNRCRLERLPPPGCGGRLR